VTRLRWSPPGGDSARDAGMSTVEVVLWAPVIAFVLVMLVGLGMIANAKGVVDSAASDAARMGSLQRTSGQANAQALSVADLDTQGSVSCANGPGGAPGVQASGFAAGGLYRVVVTCKVSILGYTETLTSTAVSPVDPYREVN
jgi:Flp pilus assembly protein TadG